MNGHIVTICRRISGLGRRISSLGRKFLKSHWERSVSLLTLVCILSQPIFISPGVVSAQETSLLPREESSQVEESGPPGGPGSGVINMPTGNVNLTVPLGALATTYIPKYQISLLYNSSNVTSNHRIWNVQAPANDAGAGWIVAGAAKIYRNIYGTGNEGDDLYYFKDGPLTHELVYDRTGLEKSEGKIVDYYAVKNAMTNDIIYRVSDENPGRWVRIDSKGFRHTFGGASKKTKRPPLNPSTPEEKVLLNICREIIGDYSPTKINLALDCDTGPIEKGVVWGNWIGPSVQEKNQQPIELGWNRSSITYGNGTQTTFSYVQVIQAVGASAGALSYSKSAYLYKVQQDSGYRIFLNYKHRVQGAGDLVGGPIFQEYTDPWQINEEPDGYQEYLRILYLDSVDTYNDHDLHLTRRQLGYDFLVSKNEDPHMARRVLTFVSNLFVSEIDGSLIRSAPDTLYSYWGAEQDDDVFVTRNGVGEKLFNPENGALYGALKSVTSPMGAIKTFRYKKNVLSSVDRKIGLPTELRNRGVLFGDNYAIVTGNENTRIYTWTQLGWKVTQLEHEINSLFNDKSGIFDGIVLERDYIAYVTIPGGGPYVTHGEAYVLYRNRKNGLWEAPKEISPGAQVRTIHGNKYFIALLDAASRQVSVFSAKTLEDLKYDVQHNYDAMAVGPDYVLGAVFHGAKPDADSPQAAKIDLYLSAFNYKDNSWKLTVKNDMPLGMETHVTHVQPVEHPDATLIYTVYKITANRFLGVSASGEGIVLYYTQRVLGTFAIPEELIFEGRDQPNDNNVLQTQIIFGKPDSDLDTIYVAQPDMDFTRLKDDPVQGNDWFSMGYTSTASGNTLSSLSHHSDSEYLDKATCVNHIFDGAEYTRQEIPGCHGVELIDDGFLATANEDGNRDYFYYDPKSNSFVDTGNAQVAPKSRIKKNIAREVLGYIQEAIGYLFLVAGFFDFPVGTILSSVMLGMQVASSLLHDTTIPPDPVGLSFSSHYIHDGNTVWFRNTPENTFSALGRLTDKEMYWATYEAGQSQFLYSVSTDDGPVTHYRLLRNGQLGDEKTIAATNQIVHDKNDIIRNSSLSSFITYQKNDGRHLFHSTGEWYLYRFAQDEAIGSLTDYVVEQIEIFDGENTFKTGFTFEESSAAYNGVGLYSKAVEYPGAVRDSKGKFIATYGRREYKFFNGTESVPIAVEKTVSGVGESNFSDVSTNYSQVLNGLMTVPGVGMTVPGVGKSNFSDVSTNYSQVLNGLMYESIVYADTNLRINDSKTSFKIWDVENRFATRIVSTESKSDGEDNSAEAFKRIVIDPKTVDTYLKDAIGFYVKEHEAESLAGMYFEPYMATTTGKVEKRKIFLAVGGDADGIVKEGSDVQLSPEELCADLSIPAQSHMYCAVLMGEDGTLLLPTENVVKVPGDDNLQQGCLAIGSVVGFQVFASKYTSGASNKCSKNFRFDEKGFLRRGNDYVRGEFFLEPPDSHVLSSLKYRYVVTPEKPVDYAGKLVATVSTLKSEYNSKLQVRSRSVEGRSFDPIANTVITQTAIDTYTYAWEKYDGMKDENILEASYSVENTIQQENEPPVSVGYKATEYKRWFDKFWLPYEIKGGVSSSEFFPHITILERNSDAGELSNTINSIGYSSSEWFTNSSLVKGYVSFGNSRPTTGLTPGDSGYYGAEEYEKEQHYSMQTSTRSEESSYTGTYALTGMQKDWSIQVPMFQPDNGRYYTVGVWASTGKGETKCSIGFGSDLRSYTIDEQWQYIEHVSLSNGNLQSPTVACESNNVFLDDFRFAPVDSIFAATVFDLERSVLSATVSLGNATKRYFYDEFRRGLVNYVEVKDGDKRGIRISSLAVGGAERFGGFNEELSAYSSSSGPVNYETGIGGNSSGSIAITSKEDLTVHLATGLGDTSINDVGSRFVFQGTIADIGSSSRLSIKTNNQDTDIVLSYDTAKKILRLTQGRQSMVSEVLPGDPKRITLVVIDQAIFLFGSGKLLISMQGIRKIPESGAYLASDDMAFGSYIFGKEPVIAMSYLDSLARVKQNQYLLAVNGALETVVDETLYDGWGNAAVISHVASYTDRVDKLDLFGYRSSFIEEYNWSTGELTKGYLSDYFLTGKGKEIPQKPNDHLYPVMRATFENSPIHRAKAHTLGFGEDFKIGNSNANAEIDYGATLSKDDFSEIGFKPSFEDSTFLRKSQRVLPFDTDTEVKKEVFEDTFGRIVAEKTGNDAESRYSAARYQLNVKDNVGTLEEYDTVFKVTSLYAPNYFDSTIAGHKNYIEKNIATDPFGQHNIKKTPDGSEFHSIFGKSGAGADFRFYRKLVEKSDISNKPYQYKKYDKLGRLIETGILKGPVKELKFYLEKADDLTFPDASQACIVSKINYDVPVDFRTGKLIPNQEPGVYTGKLFSVLTQEGEPSSGKANCFLDTSSDGEGGIVIENYNRFNSRHEADVRGVATYRIGDANEVVLLERRNTGFTFNNANYLTSTVYPTENKLSSKNVFDVSGQETVYYHFDQLGRLESVCSSEDCSGEIYFSEPVYTVSLGLDSYKINDGKFSYKSTFDFQGRRTGIKLSKDSNALFSENIEYESFQYYSMPRKITYGGEGLGNEGHTYEYDYTIFGQLKKATRKQNSTITDTYEYSFDKNGNLVAVDEESLLANLKKNKVFKNIPGTNKADGGVKEIINDGKENGNLVAVDEESFRVNLKKNKVFKNIPGTNKLQILVENGKETLEYKYDADGGVKEIINDGKVQKIVRRAGDGDILSVEDTDSKLSYSYDALSRRTKKELNTSEKRELTNYYYGAGNTILLKEVVKNEDSDNSKEAVIEQNIQIFLPGNQLLAVKSGDQTQYSVADHLNSVRLVLEKDGSIAGSFDYSPAGELVHDVSENVKIEQRFAGALYEESIKMYTFPLRFMDPKTSRFLSRDPYPVDMNSYMYVNGNPVTNVDPSGGAWYSCIFFGNDYSRGSTPAKVVSVLVQTLAVSLMSLGINALVLRITGEAASSYLSDSGVALTPALVMTVDSIITPIRGLVGAFMDRMLESKKKGLQKRFSESKGGKEKFKTAAKAGGIELGGQFVQGLVGTGVVAVASWTVAYKGMIPWPKGPTDNALGWYSFTTGGAPEVTLMSMAGGFIYGTLRMYGSSWDPERDFQFKFFGKLLSRQAVDTLKRTAYGGFEIGKISVTLAQGFVKEGLGTLFTIYMDKEKRIKILREEQVLPGEARARIRGDGEGDGEVFEFDHHGTPQIQELDPDPDPEPGNLPGAPGEGPPDDAVIESTWV